MTNSAGTGPYSPADIRRMRRDSAIALVLLPVMCFLILIVSIDDALSGETSVLVDVSGWMLIASGVVGLPGCSPSGTHGEPRCAAGPPSMPVLAVALGGGPGGSGVTRPPAPPASPLNEKRAPAGTFVAGRDPFRRSSAQKRRVISARLTSWIALVTSMPRGHASVQLKVVRQRHTPSLSLRISSRCSPRLVAGVEDEAVRVDDRRRAEVLAVVPEHRARGGARRAQDALGGVVEALAVLRGLVALAGRLVPAS